MYISMTSNVKGTQCNPLVVISSHTRQIPERIVSLTGSLLVSTKAARSKQSLLVKNFESHVRSTLPVDVA